MSAKNNSVQGLLSTSGGQVWMELLLGKLRTAAKANAFRLEPPWQVVEPLFGTLQPFWR